MLDCGISRIYGPYGMYNWEIAIEVVAKRAGGAPIIAFVLTRAAVLSGKPGGAVRLKTDEGLGWEPR